MSGLGILAGLGEGYVAGKRASLEADRMKQENEIRANQVKQAKDAEDLRQQLSTEAGNIDANATAARQADIDTINASKADKAKGIAAVSQAASAQDNFSRQPGTGIASPSTSAIADDTQTGQPDLKGIVSGAQHADMTTGAPVTNAPNAPGAPVNLANSPGIRPNAAAAPSSIDTAQVAPKEAYIRKATGALYDSMATAALQKGMPEVAQKFQEMGKSNAAYMFQRQFTQAQADLSSGNDQAAAASISALYNMGFPDGKHVDIKAVGGGKFQTVQYDTETGKPIAGQTIDAKTLNNLLITQMNPAEWAKMIVSQNLEDSRQNVANTYAAQRDRSNQLNSDNQMNKLATLLTMNQKNNDTKITVNTDSNASRERIADGKTGGTGSADKALDAQLKESNALTEKYITDHKLTDPAARSYIGPTAAKYVKAGDDPATANAKAFNEWNSAASGAKQQATQDFNAADSNGSIMPGKPSTKELLKQSDADAYKKAGGDSNFNPSKWKTFHEENLRSKAITSPGSPAANASGANKVIKFNSKGEPI